MKTMMKKLVLLASVIALMSALLAISAFAVINYESTDFASNYFYGSTNKNPMTYKVGETMEFTISLKTKSGDLVSVPYFSYSFSGDDGIVSSGKVNGANGTFTVSHKITCPGFVRLTVKAMESDGAVITGTDSDGGEVSVVFNGGACAEWEKIETAMAEPDDFDEYWARTLLELDAVAPTIYDLKVDTLNTDKDYTVYDLYVNAPGSKNFLNTAAKGEEPNGATYMAGKLTVPKNIEQGNAKFYLNFQGAGVYKSPGISKKAGYVTLCVYAHSIELSREAEYYKNLENGLLSGYMRRALYNDNAEESYTKYMVLRDLQAVRFLKTFFGENGGNVSEFNGIDISAWKGLWNGKDIDLYGQSQGGFQCIAVAALDHDITLCRPWVPCWCDMYAKNYFPTRRTMGLVYEHYSQKYFDSVALGKRIVCRTQVNTGFGDDTCPTTGVIAAYNAMTCEKVLNIYQGMAHNCDTSYASGVSKQKYTSGNENFKIPYNWEYTFDWEIAEVSDESVLQILSDGKTVRALKKGTATVDFVDTNRNSILVEVEKAKLDVILSDGTLDAQTADGMIKSIYTRTARTAFVCDSADDFAAEIQSGNFEKGITYFVVSNLGGDVTYTAEEMYSLFEASGADYLVLIPSSELDATSAAMYLMQMNQSKYQGAYVCDNGTANLFEAGRNAGNNIVSIIEKNKPVLDSDYRMYDSISGNEIKKISVLPAGEEFSLIFVLNQPFAIANSIEISVTGLQFDAETMTVTGDSDGGSIFVNGNEYTVYANVTDSGIEDGYSWVLDANGKLIVLCDGEIGASTQPWASYASTIKEIEISTGVTKIASGAFAGFSALEKLTLPYTINEIAADAVSGAALFTVYGYENNNAATSFASNAGLTFVSLGACGSAGDSLIWEYRDNTLYISGNGSTIVSGVTKYNGEESSAWYNYYTQIEKVVICDSVTTIGPYAFHFMKNLTTVEFTENLTKIGAAAFENATSLNCVYIKGSTPVVGKADLSKITTFEGSYQLDGCKLISDIILSDNLTSGIPDKFIGYNTSIKSLVVPESVPSIHKRALYRNTALKELTVLGFDTVLPADMLTYDNNTTTLTKIYGRAGSAANTFADNNGIEFVDLTGDKYDGEIAYPGKCGDDVYFKLIENELADTYTIYFYGNGTSIESGNTASSIYAPWLSYIGKITSAVFRGNITSIGEYTLSGMSSLKSIVLDGCAFTDICENAFACAGISGTFEIPESVTAINANAFVGNDQLTAVVIHNSEAVIDEDAFAGTGVNTVHGFLKSTAEDYATAKGLNFVNIDEHPIIDSGLCKEGGYAWSLNDIGTLTISGSGDGSGILAFEKTPDYKDLTPIAWYKHLDNIKKVVIEEETKITNIVSYGLSNMKNCETIIVPSTLTDLSAYNVLSVLHNLNTLAVQGEEVVEGVIDLRNVTKYNSQLFEKSFSYTKPTIYLPADPNSLNISKWAEKCEELTFMTYPTCSAATKIREIAAKQNGDEPSSSLPKNVVLKYYPVELAPELVRSGSQTLKNGHMDWVINDATGVLTFTKGAAAASWNEFLCSKNSKELLAFKAIWKDAVIHVEIGSFNKFQLNSEDSFFSHMPNLKTVKFSNSSIEWQCSGTNGMFEGCSSLTTLGFGSNYNEGVIDLSRISKYTGNSYLAMFKGCSSITNVKFRETIPDSGSTVTYHLTLTPSFFENCTSLISIEIPGWITTIGTNAFSGCTSLTSITLNSCPTIADATAFPDNEGQNLVIHCPDQKTADAIKALNYTYTKAIYLGNLKAAASMDGYAVRLEKYNGLRGLCSFDNTIKAENELNGYKLVEFGAILSSENAYNSYGKELSLIDGEYTTANSSVIKKPVYIGDNKVGNTLDSSTEDMIKFAATIIKFENNFRSNVYICAYEIWEISEGNHMIIYNDCQIDEYDFTSIYEISLNMYRDGIVNSSNDKEGIVWDIIENNGAVTLKAGTDYTYIEGQTDLSGNSLAESFKFVNIPAVNQTTDPTNKTITFNPTSTNISLFEDGDDYVAIYRGSGAIPSANALGAAGSSQLVANFCSDYQISSVPNPKMSAATASKIRAIVLDYGITTISSGAFSHMTTLEKLVYPTTVTSSKGNTFVSCSSLKTAYCADVNNPEYRPKTNVLDFNSISSVAVNYMFTSCKAAEYIHLPLGIEANGEGMINSCTSLKALWCGNSKMTEGTADFTGTTITTFGDYSFAGANNITSLKLPATVTTFFDVSGSEERHAFEGSAIKTIITESEVAKISEYIENYGETYGLTYKFGNSET